MVKRFEVYLINLDDEISDDPKNTRPAVVVSPDEMNANLDHVMIAPIASTRTPYPTRVETEFLNAKRWVILDQIRTIDHTRLAKKIGKIDEKTADSVLGLLAEMFAP
ncbi:type II toxin-antitoxin system PemK/MazF family toxin [Leptolyngbya sp. 7M]|uniref:type II toxin-antitoxin system PemK/MazF family toxin n=1 Tax=Leptolyngbya sp. 7M TaxID=2812896 RepID=UPI001B8C8893|nr:type II toxin-antitoxin system PemK/MazF family toxin [Leptolyngbya sp. 7M]QYO62185.1 type II toxin-antitoxin system PemK/MazF family toxin [Leptolyngbya sp. 7M]